MPQRDELYKTKIQTSLHFSRFCSAKSCTMFSNFKYEISPTVLCGITVRTFKTANAVMPHDREAGLCHIGPVGTRYRGLVNLTRRSLCSRWIEHGHPAAPIE